MIKENLESVHERINRASDKCNRSASDIVLVAVSKTKPVELLREAYDVGVRDFGENYVQEIVEKYDLLPKDIRWHMIGHLQRNKVKYIIDKVYMIHSVDSLRLAHTISEEAVKHGLSMKILLEANIAKEETKFGFSVDELMSCYEELCSLPGLEVCGLMTSAPYTSEPESNRQYFHDLNQLCVDLKGKNIDNNYMNFLSMGMTGDFEVAIEEGATHVRIGTAIFGERDYRKA